MTDMSNFVLCINWRAHFEQLSSVVVSVTVGCINNFKTELRGMSQQNYW